jgi:hypothetical protein
MTESISIFGGLYVYGSTLKSALLDLLDFIKLTNYYSKLLYFHEK